MNNNPEDYDMTPAGIFHRMESRCSYFLQFGTEYNQDWMLELHQTTKDLNAIIAQMQTVTQADADRIAILVNEVNGSGTGWWDYKLHMRSWFETQGFKIDIK